MTIEIKKYFWINKLWSYTGKEQKTIWNVIPELKNRVINGFFSSTRSDFLQIPSEFSFAYSKWLEKKKKVKKKVKMVSTQESIKDHKEAFYVFSFSLFLKIFVTSKCL